MLGLGALTLPSVFVRLGWLPASALLAVCALGALYSGRLSAAMAQQVGMLVCFYTVAIIGLLKELRTLQGLSSIAI